MNIKNIVLTGMFIALGVLLPIAFHPLGDLGRAFLPMHIPVILCGLICGYRLGGIAGAMVPLVSSVATGMPPLYPVAIFMMCELAAYGIITGLMIKKFNVIISLIVAMIGGRVVLGIAQMILLGINANVFEGYLKGAFVTAIPGIILQIIVVPIIIIALQRAKLIPLEK